MDDYHKTAHGCALFYHIIIDCIFFVHASVVWPKAHTYIQAVHIIKHYQIKLLCGVRNRCYGGQRG